MLRKFAIGILLFASWVSANADVLMWQVNSDSQVIDQQPHTIYSYLQTMMPIGDNQTWAAQIYVKDSDGNVLKTLENISGNSVGNSWDKMIDANPLAASAVSSVMAESQAHNALGQGNYYQVRIKLGTLAINSGNYIYQDMLYSANFSGRYLEAHHDYNFSYDDDDSQLNPWIPDEFYSNDTLTPFVDYNSIPGINVPEPSSALLVLVGFIFLGLKHRVVNHGLG